MKLDSKQVELIATSWMEAQLMRKGYEVARPLRDKGIDIIAYRDDPDHAFSATPIQIKSAQKKTFSIQKKYADRNIVMAYIWNATSDAPTLFLVPYAEAVQLLDSIGDAINSTSWVEYGAYSSQSPSKALIEKMKPFKDNFACL